jgi:uncharacterized protein (TIGR01777 family)
MCLSRKKRKHGKVKNYHWDVSTSTIDENALEDVHAIIHLAGENVAGGRWTAKQKRKIIESRTESTKLLYQAVEVSDTKPILFLSASGIGFYGENTHDKIMKENAQKGDGFLADVVDAWEQSADNFKTLGMRVVKLRIGMVLSDLGGALEKIALPIKYGMGAALGSGNQNVSWIHIDDLCRLILWIIEHDKVNGIYNATATYSVTNQELTRIIAKAINRKVILPNVPEFVLKMMLGEMSSIVLGGNKASNEKLTNLGFKFKYQNVKEAIDQILNKN